MRTAAFHPRLGAEQTASVNTYLELATRVAFGALGGAFVALALASRVAHRQEIAKAHAAALLELRSLVAGHMAYNAYFHATMRAGTNYSGDPLKVQHRRRVACDLVAVAWRLPPKMQSRVRAHLVPIFGELVVVGAERLALAPLTTHAAKDDRTWSADQLDIGLLLGDGPAEGSFDAFAKNPRDVAAHEKVKADMAALLKRLGGDPRLGASRRT